MQHVTHPGGYGRERWELFTHIFRAHLWALCSLLDKRRMHLASSSWPAYVGHGSIFLFVVEQFVSTSTGTERMGAVVLLSVIAHTHRDTQMYVTMASSLFAWLVFDPQGGLYSPNKITSVPSHWWIGRFLNWRKLRSSAYIAAGCAVEPFVHHSLISGVTLLTVYV